MTSADRPIIVRCVDLAEAREYVALLDPIYPGRIVTQQIGPDVVVSVRAAA